MTNEICNSYFVTVEIQENGIIRDQKGNYMGRVDNEYIPPICETKEKLSVKEILGSDLNQSLHHLIGYWYATPTYETFDTELACKMIDYCLYEVENDSKKKL